MIQRAFITQWGKVAPWRSLRQVEQDLIICRALVSIYQDAFLAEHLAFRGGTALHSFSTIACRHKEVCINRIEG